MVFFFFFRTETINNSAIIFLKYIFKYNHSNGGAGDELVWYRKCNPYWFLTLPSYFSKHCRYHRQRLPMPTCATSRKTRIMQWKRPLMSPLWGRRKYHPHLLFRVRQRMLRISYHRPVNSQQFHCELWFDVPTVNLQYLACSSTSHFLPPFLLED